MSWGGCDDLFTGFTFEFPLTDDGAMYLLNEDDNSVIQDNEYGIVYEAVFKSESKDKIDKIKMLWETMEDE